MAEDKPEMEKLSNGKVKFNLPDQVITLRRPTVGEYRKLRELLDAVVAAPKEEPDQKGKDQPTLPSRGDLTEDFSLWTTEAIKVLGDKSLDLGPDEVPLFFGNPFLPVQLVEHWRAVPAGPS